MSPKDYAKRITAIKVANTPNKIEGVPVSDYARQLSEKWAKDEITANQMKTALNAKHKNNQNIESKITFFICRISKLWDKKV